MTTVNGAQTTSFYPDSINQRKTRQTGLISSTAATFINAAGTTTEYATEVHGTYIDDTYAQVLSTGSRVFYEIKDDENGDLLDVIKPTGLVSSASSTIVKNDATTAYTTEYYRTFIEGKYAQLVSSYSTVIYPPWYSEQLVATSTLAFDQIHSGSVFQTPVNGQEVTSFDVSAEIQKPVYHSSASPISSRPAVRPTKTGVFGPSEVVHVTGSQASFVEGKHGRLTTRNLFTGTHVQDSSTYLFYFGNSVMPLTTRIIGEGRPKEEQQSIFVKPDRFGDKVIVDVDEKDGAHVRLPTKHEYEVVPGVAALNGRPAVGVLIESSKPEEGFEIDGSSDLEFTPAVITVTVGNLLADSEVRSHGAGFWRNEDTVYQFTSVPTFTKSDLDNEVGDNEILSNDLPTGRKAQSEQTVVESIKPTPASKSIGLPTFTVSSGGASLEEQIKKANEKIKSNMQRKEEDTEASTDNTVAGSTREGRTFKGVRVIRPDLEPEQTAVPVVSTRMPTVTYVGFVDFTTTIQGTKVIFMPRSALEERKRQEQKIDFKEGLRITPSSPIKFNSVEDGQENKDEDFGMIKDTKTFLHGQGMATETVRGHTVSHEKSMLVSVVGSKKQRGGKLLPGGPIADTNNDLQLLDGTLDSSFEETTTPTLAPETTTASDNDERVINAAPHKPGQENEVFSTASTSVFNQDKSFPTGLVTSIGGTIANHGMTTLFTTFVYGTFIEGNYAQIVQSTSSIFYLVSKPSAVDLATKAIEVPNAVAEKSAVDLGRSVGSEGDEQTIVDAGITEEDGTNTSKGRVILVTRNLPKTFYTTFTYFTTFFIPEGSSTRMSVNTRKETSSSVGFVENIVTSTLSAFGASEQEANAATTGPMPTFAPTTEKLEELDTTTLQPSTESPDEEERFTIRTLYTTYTYFSTFFFGDSSTSVSSRTEVVSNTVRLPVGRKEKEQDAEELESVSNPGVQRPTTAFAEDEGGTTAGLLKEFVTGRDGRLSSYVETLLKTYYTTYTYFTTLFGEQTTSVTSHTEVYSNVLTTSGYLLVEADEVLPTTESTQEPTTEDPIVTEKIAEVTPSGTLQEELPEARKLEQSESAADLTTLTTTYTYLTTLVDGETSTVSRFKEMFTNVLSNGVTKHSGVMTSVPIEEPPKDPASGTESVDETFLLSTERTITDPAGIEPTPTEVDQEDTEVFLKTYFTTYTYFTTFFRSGSSRVVSNEETETNVVTVTVTGADSATASVAPAPSVQPITYYTTYTYHYTFKRGEDLITSTSEETVTNVVQPTAGHEVEHISSTQAGPSSIAAVLQATPIVESPLESSISKKEMMSSIITYYTTYTYFTTAYRDSATIVDSRLEVVSNVVTELIEKTESTLIAPTPAKTKNAEIMSTKQPEGETPTSVISENVGSIVEGATTTHYTTRAIGTSIGQLFAQVVESTSSIEVDSSLALEDGHNPQKTGLVKVIAGSIVKGKDTTWYTSSIVGTFLDGTYAQVVESTTSYSLVPEEVLKTAATPGFGAETTTLEPSELNASTEQGVHTSPISAEEDEEEGTTSDTGDKAKSFVPVIRPFRSRTRPAFVPRKKTESTSSPATVTRQSVRPTVVATPAKSNSAVATGLPGRGQRGSTSSSRRPGFQPSRQSTGGFRPATSSRTEPVINTALTSSSRRPVGFSRLPATALPINTVSSTTSSRRPLFPSKRPLFGRPSPTQAAPAQEISPSRVLADNGGKSLEINDSIESNSIDAKELSKPQPAVADTRAERPIRFSAARRPRPSSNKLLDLLNRSRGRTSEAEEAGSAKAEEDASTLSQEASPSVQSLPSPQRSSPAITRTTTTEEPSTTTRPVLPSAFRTTRKPRAGSLFPSRDFLSRLRGRSRAPQQEESEVQTDQELAAEPSRHIPSYRFRSGGLGRRKLLWVEDEETIADIGEGELEEEINREKRQADFGARSRGVRQQKIATAGSSVPQTLPVASDADSFTVRRLEQLRRNRQRLAAAGARPQSSVPSRTSSASLPETGRTTSQTGRRFRRPTTESIAQTDSRRFPLGRTRGRAPTTSSPITNLRFRDTAGRGSSGRRFTLTNPRNRFNTFQTSDYDYYDEYSDVALDPSTSETPAPVMPDGKITVTHHVPMAATIPIVHNGITQLKEVITASPSLQVLEPSQYTASEAGGSFTVVLSEVSNAVNPGVTEVTRYYATPSVTDSVTFTPTVIRGRSTSASHIVPHTAYIVSETVSTVTDPTASLADLLSQLLLGQVAQQNPLNALNPLGALAPAATAKLETVTYVTTLTKEDTTVLPIILRGQKIETTIVNTATEVITATEVKTIPIEALQQTAPALGLPGLNNQFQNFLLPALAPALLQQQQEQQRQIQQLQLQQLEKLKKALPLLTEVVSTVAPQIQITKSADAKLLEATAMPADISPAAARTSIVTLFISGKHPGEFSTVLSTVILDSKDSSVRKREIENQKDPLLGSHSFQYEVYSNDIPTDMLLNDVDFYLQSAIEDIPMDAYVHETRSLDSMLSQQTVKGLMQVAGKHTDNEETDYFLVDGPAELPRLSRKPRHAQGVFPVQPAFEVPGLQQQQQKIQEQIRSIQQLRHIQPFLTPQRNAETVMGSQGDLSFRNNEELTSDIPQEAPFFELSRGRSPIQQQAAPQQSAGRKNKNLWFTQPDGAFQQFVQNPRVLTTDSGFFGGEGTGWSPLKEQGESFSLDPSRPKVTSHSFSTRIFDTKSHPSGPENKKNINLRGRDPVAIIELPPSEVNGNPLSFHFPEIQVGNNHFTQGFSTPRDRPSVNLFAHQQNRLFQPFTIAELEKEEVPPGVFDVPRLDSATAGREPVDALHGGKQIQVPETTTLQQPNPEAVATKSSEGTTSVPTTPSTPSRTGRGRVRGSILRSSQLSTTTKSPEVASPAGIIRSGGRAPSHTRSRIRPTPKKSSVHSSAISSPTTRHRSPVGSTQVADSQRAIIGRLRGRHRGQSASQEQSAHEEQDGTNVSAAPTQAPRVTTRVRPPPTLQSARKAPDSLPAPDSESILLLEDKDLKKIHEKGDEEEANVQVNSRGTGRTLTLDAVQQEFQAEDKGAEGGLNLEPSSEAMSIDDGTPLTIFKYLYTMYDGDHVEFSTRHVTATAGSNAALQLDKFLSSSDLDGHFLYMEGSSTVALGEQVKDGITTEINLASSTVIRNQQTSVLPEARPSESTSSKNETSTRTENAQDITEVEPNIVNTTPTPDRRVQRQRSPAPRPVSVQSRVRASRIFSRPLQSTVSLSERATAAIVAAQRSTTRSLRRQRGFSSQAPPASRSRAIDDLGEEEYEDYYEEYEEPEPTQKPSREIAPTTTQQPPVKLNRSRPVPSRRPAKPTFNSKNATRSRTRSESAARLKALLGAIPPSDDDSDIIVPKKATAKFFGRNPGSARSKLTFPRSRQSSRLFEDPGTSSAIIWHTYSTVVSAPGGKEPSTIFTSSLRTVTPQELSSLILASEIAVTSVTGPPTTESLEMDLTTTQSTAELLEGSIEDTTEAVPLPIYRFQPVTELRTVTHSVVVTRQAGQDIDVTTEFSTVVKTAVKTSVEILASIGNMKKLLLLACCRISSFNKNLLPFYIRLIVLFSFSYIL